MVSTDEMTSFFEKAYRIPCLFELGTILITYAEDKVTPTSKSRTGAIF